MQEVGLVSAEPETACNQPSEQPASEKHPTEAGAQPSGVEADVVDLPNGKSDNNAAKAPMESEGAAPERSKLGEATVQQAEKPSAAELGAKLAAVPQHDDSDAAGKPVMQSSADEHMLTGLEAAGAPNQAPASAANLGIAEPLQQPPEAANGQPGEQVGRAADLGAPDQTQQPLKRTAEVRSYSDSGSRASGLRAHSAFALCGH